MPNYANYVPIQISTVCCLPRKGLNLCAVYLVLECLDEFNGFNYTRSTQWTSHNRHHTLDITHLFSHTRNHTHEMVHSTSHTRYHTRHHTLTHFITHLITHTLPHTPISHTLSLTLITYTSPHISHTSSHTAVLSHTL